eukprot:7391995-Prymnesium_polylepis.2
MGMRQGEDRCECTDGVGHHGVLEATPPVAVRAADELVARAACWGEGGAEQPHGVARLEPCGQAPDARRGQLAEDAPVVARHALALAPLELCRVFRPLHWHQREEDEPVHDRV